MPTRRRIALDADTALEDGQWDKLKAFLAAKLSDEDMQTVEEICRGGGDAPARVTAAADRAPVLPHAARRPAPSTVKYGAESFPHSNRLKIGG